MILEKLRAIIETKYGMETNISSANAGGIISTIIDTILSLVKNCLPIPLKPAAEEISKIVKTNPVLAQVRVRQAMREAGIYKRPDREAIVRVIMETGAQATVEDVMAVRAECDFIM